jgi:lactate dehydrogenase-like 2-hydroxyacid dehydrogenase
VKPKILVTRQVFPEIVAALQDRFDVEHNDDDRPWPPDELARRLADKQGVLATVMDRIDETVLAAAPGLKVVSNIAVGTNNVDIAACTRRGIRVTNTPGVLDDTTADLTFALLMAAARRIAEGEPTALHGPAGDGNGSLRTRPADGNVVGCDASGSTRCLIEPCDRRTAKCV